MSTEIPINPITDEERQAVEAFSQANPRMSEVLPTYLPGGNYLEKMAAICSSCKERIPEPSNWVNRVTHELSGQTVEVWTIYGICADCRCLTRCLFRFRSTGAYDALINNRWMHGVLEKRQPAWQRRLLKLAKALGFKVRPRH